jgi:hypothetical protein
MALSYVLAPNPKWYIADNYGRPLAGGTLYTYRNLNRSQFKPTFQDPAGFYPWTDPILFDANGSQGPIYWQVDSNNPQETYFLEVFDSQGNLQWTVENFAPGGTGGGSIITSVNTIENLITNNVMYRNIGQSTIPAPQFLILAPGNHDGLTDTPAHAGPEITFFKNNGSATDQLTFMNFLANDLTIDVTPVQYLNYSCTGAGTSETFKYVQFPITNNVQNLNGQEMSVSIWARCNSGSSTLILAWRQFFGDGGASPDVVTPIATLTLTSSWAQYQITSSDANIPILAAPTIGACGNSGLFLQVQYPLDSATNIDFIKPAAFLGNLLPSEDYQTYDMIDSVIAAQRTGDIRVSNNSFYPYGWLLMDDGSIGSPSSGATNRANTDTFPLYNLIWNSVNQAWAPIPGGRGASAIIDFTANKAMLLTRALGRVFAGTTPTQITQQVTSFNFGSSFVNVPSTANIAQGAPIVLTNTGGALPVGIVAGRVYYAIIGSTTVLALATSPENAVIGSQIAFSAPTTGTSFVTVTPWQLGQWIGEVNHTLTISEMPAHSHTVFGTVNMSTSVSGSGGPNVNVIVQANNQAPTLNNTLLSGNTGVTGSGSGVTILQPTTYMNVFIKL